MQLKFEREELLESHDYAKPQVLNGTQLHGGFLEDGSYRPPRTLVRQPAIDNWTANLAKAGGAPIDADSSLLTGPRVPNPAQTAMLIESGLDFIFWSRLTIIGKIEARGQMLATTPFPDLQNYIVEDISEMAIGHLTNGLLYAHGVDEGGEPEKSIGGHDQMWFVARDLVFADHDFKDVDPPASIGRDDAGTRRMPELPLELEGYLSFLMNLLMIEFRAEIGFADNQRILRMPNLFADRRKEAEEAAEIIERIRTDERVHVDSLRLYLGELRNVHFKGENDQSIPGHGPIDRVWQGLVNWATVESPARESTRNYGDTVELIKKLVKTPRAKRSEQAVLADFEKLRDEHFLLAAGGA